MLLLMRNMLYTKVVGKYYWVFNRSMHNVFAQNAEAVWDMHVCVQEIQKTTTVCLQENYNEDCIAIVDVYLVFNRSHKNILIFF